jgi:hypothetical protein
VNRIKRDIVIVGAPFNKRFALFPLYTEERESERERERERERENKFLKKKNRVFI